MAVRLPSMASFPLARAARTGSCPVMTAVSVGASVRITACGLVAGARAAVVARAARMVEA
jgi:hypothetical protein